MNTNNGAAQMTFTQTSEQASAKLLRFQSRAECQAFLDEHNLAACVSFNGHDYIGIFMDDRGVFGVSSATTGELLPDW